MREAHVLHVRHEALRHLAVRQEAIAFFGHARPRAEMHLVHRDRPIEPRALRRTRGRPLRVVPLVPRHVVDDGRGLRWHFERDAEGIRFLENGAGARADLEFVAFAVGEPGQKDLPDAARREKPHRVHAAVPRVEVADHAHAIGIRRPHGEVDAGGRPHLDAMRAEFFERAMMRAFAEQMQIEIGQHTAVPIGIIDLDDVIAGIADAEPIVGTAWRAEAALRRRRKRRLEDARRMPPRHRQQLAGRDAAQRHRARGGLERAHHPVVRTEHRERIAIGARNERGNRRIECAQLVDTGHWAILQGVG